MKINYASNDKLVEIGSLEAGDTCYNPEQCMHLMVIQECFSPDRYALNLSNGLFFNINHHQLKVIKTTAEVNINAT